MRTGLQDNIYNVSSVLLTKAVAIYIKIRGVGITNVLKVIVPGESN